MPYISSFVCDKWVGPNGRSISFIAPSTLVSIASPLPAAQRKNCCRAGARRCCSRRATLLIPAQAFEDGQRTAVFHTRACAAFSLLCAGRAVVGPLCTRAPRPTHGPRRHQFVRPAPLPSTQACSPRLNTVPSAHQSRTHATELPLSPVYHAAFCFLCSVLPCGLVAALGLLSTPPLSFPQFDADHSMRTPHR